MEALIQLTIAPPAGAALGTRELSVRNLLATEVVP
jgi:hypothetical protein